MEPDSVSMRKRGDLMERGTAIVADAYHAFPVGFFNSTESHGYERLWPVKPHRNGRPLIDEELKHKHEVQGIVGRSEGIRHVLRQVGLVAATNSTVLIQGESGTGKELVARAVHDLSERREAPFVILNCTAIPAGLLESELFGHERGAFTGAITKKIGRFELAAGGTLFMDEVGDIPLELQPKLLRVLQDQEFERLGSTKTIRPNVRVVAVTNANLEQMVNERRFRSDLYYRLNVFPIRMPALRERTEDIPLLVRYFVQKYGRQMHKMIQAVPTEVMNALTTYHWPGNIRELEHFVERAMILSSDSKLCVPWSELKRTLESSAVCADSTKTLEEVEREHILNVLQVTRWRVGGPSGAAVRLGTKRTTLQSRMQKLGIARQACLA